MIFKAPFIVQRLLLSPISSHRLNWISSLVLLSFSLSLSTSNRAQTTEASSAAAASNATLAGNTTSFTGTSSAIPATTFSNSSNPTSPSPASIGMGQVFRTTQKGSRSGFTTTVRHRRKHTENNFSLLGSTTNKQAVQEIEMYAGESRVFPAPGVARIAVGNGQIMSAAALDNKEVLVFANAIGTSSLFVWNANGRYQHVKVHIVAGETSRFAREVAAFLASIPNTKTSIIGDKVVVEGDNLTDLDLAKIEELSKRYPQVVNFTNRLGWEQMVLMDVKVVEFPRKELQEIGLKWNAAGGAAVGGIWSPFRRGLDGSYQIGLPANSPITSADSSQPLSLPSRLNVLSGINMGLTAQLNMLAQEGKAAILAEPQLSARNGAKATFLAGGEYPYTVSTVNGQTVIFKPYGIRLDIQPRVDHSGTIRATIDSEVSSIDTSITTPSGPALRARRTNTEFNVKQGETIVLSGLLSRDSSTDIDKVPLLGDFPVLGAMFRSKRYQNNETELVVFVTPSIIDSHTPELNQRIADAQTQLEKVNGGRAAFLPQVPPKVIASPAPITTAVEPSAATTFSAPTTSLTPVVAALIETSAAKNVDIKAVDIKTVPATTIASTASNTATLTSTATESKTTASSSTANAIPIAQPVVKEVHAVSATEKTVSNITTIVKTVQKPIASNPATKPIRSVAVIEKTSSAILETKSVSSSSAPKKPARLKNKKQKTKVAKNQKVVPVTVVAVPAVSEAPKPVVATEPVPAEAPKPSFKPSFMNTSGS